MITEILALVISLIAVIVGPLVSLRVAKKYIRAQIILSNRINEIDDFRKNISDLLSKAWELETILTIQEQKSEGIQVEVIERASIEIMGLIPKTKLYLRPGNELDKAI